MAITVCGNCINFGSQTMCVDPAGIYVSGRFDFAGCDLNPTQAQGSVSGYTSGGGAPGQQQFDTIDKFPFTSDANATDVGNLTRARDGAAGQSSSVSGYTSGGYSENPPPGGALDIIDKFPFSADANATDVGDLTQGRCCYLAGQSSTVSGYATSGRVPFPVFAAPATERIDKFPFASDTNSTCIGNIGIVKSNVSGHSSRDYGYQTGGGPTPNPPGYGDEIFKFPFASDTNATDIAELTIGRQSGAGISSAESGYVAGGYIGSPAPGRDTIDKFPFATDAPATDVGELAVGADGAAGQSSTSSGYASGGIDVDPGSSPVVIARNTIQKFPFASDANATDIADLTCVRGSATGQQV